MFLKAYFNFFMANKRARFFINVKLTKKIITNHDNGVRISHLTKQYNFKKSTISTIIKNKERITAAKVAKGKTVSSRYDK